MIISSVGNRTAHATEYVNSIDLISLRQLEHVQLASVLDQVVDRADRKTKRTRANHEHVSALIISGVPAPAGSHVPISTLICPISKFVTGAPEELVTWLITRRVWPGLNFRIAFVSTSTR